MFNFLKSYSYLACKINFAVDRIEHDRLIRERRIARTSGSAETEANSLVTPIRGSGFIGDLIWMLRYNQLGLVDLLIFLASVAVHVLNSIPSICYILLPRERDPRTGCYLNPVMRFFESIYLVEILSKTDSSGLLNQLVLCISFPLVLRRVACLKTKLNNAKINRYKYVKLDSIQMNVAQAHHFALDSIYSWWPFLLACARHKCNRKFMLRGPNGRRLKRIARKLILLDKIDWLYCYNLIDFNSCYPEVEDGPQVIHPLRQYDSQEKKNGNSMFCCLLFEFPRSSSQTRPLFVAKPFHRMHPKAVLYLTILYLVALTALSLICMISILVYYYPIVESYGLDVDNLLTTLPGAFLKSFQDLKNVIGLISSGLWLLFLTLNLLEVTNLVHIAVSQMTRAHAVTEMLDVEVDWHRSYVKLFLKYLEQQNLSQRLEDIEMMRRTDLFRNSEVPIYAEFGDAYSSNDAQDWLSLKLYCSGAPRYRSVEQLVHDFTRSSINEEKIVEFNENINYLLILIRVLQEEQVDMKLHFTWNLNLAVFAGTIGLSIASYMFYHCESFHQLLVTTIATYTIVLPLAVSLFMGATGEIAFRKIALKLRPLMINELRFVDTNTVLKLQRIYSHLSLIENRSIMILGNLPLTFGSLISVSTLFKYNRLITSNQLLIKIYSHNQIIGWIASCNLLFQRLIY